MTLRLPQNLEDQLRTRAEREGLSMHKVIERLLAAHLDDDLEQLSDRDAKIVAIAAVEAVRYENTLERLK